MKQKMLRKDAQLAEVKLSFCEPLARGDCATAQSFYNIVSKMCNSKGRFAENRLPQVENFEK